MTGIICVNKPQEFTSFDVVASMRRCFGTKKIGHGGTLDPMATGVLPVFVGGATKAVDLVPDDSKSYRAGFRLGFVSDTQDIWGKLRSRCENGISQAEVEFALEDFRGDIMQIPPMYSALKVNGQKLCDLARKGRTVERQPRPITIHTLEYLGMENGCLKLRVDCSKGTYIRTLCQDIGEALGCGGCMEALRRTKAGEYDISQAVPLQVLLDSENPAQYLRPVDSMFASHPAVTLTANQEKRCRNGNAFSVAIADGTYRAYSQTGEFLMLARVTGGVMETVKSFFEVE